MDAINWTPVTETTPPSYKLLLVSLDGRNAELAYFTDRGYEDCNGKKLWSQNVTHFAIVNFPS